MWTKEELRIIVKSTKFLVTVSSVMSATVGATATYFTMAKKLEEKYAQISHDEIQQAKDFYRTQEPKIINVYQENGEKVEDVRSVAESLLRYQGIDPMDADTNGLGEDPLDEKIREATEAEDPTPEGLKNINIFDKPVTAGEAVLGALFEDRSPDRPYIITHDEFYENEFDFPERQLTWFAGDEVLTDEQDVPVPDVERVCGEDNLLRFGYGSNDENIVYVRNEKLKLNLEISKSEGKYAHEVAGFSQDHIEHSDRPRKMRRRFDE